MEPTNNLSFPIKYMTIEKYFLLTGFLVPYKSIFFRAYQSVFESAVIHERVSYMRHGLCYHGTKNNFISHVIHYYGSSRNDVIGDSREMPGKFFVCTREEYSGMCNWIRTYILSL